MPPTRPREGAHRLSGGSGLLLLVLLLLPFKLWRAGLESSLWIDETASLVLASQPAGVIADLSAVDTNPPGYFLALKAWLKLGRLLGREPGLLGARLLGVMGWIGLAAAVWTLGRRLFGAYGTLLAWAVAASAYAALFAKDARGYSLAAVALVVCFLTLLVLSEGGSRWLWLLYAVSAAVALWTHLLSAFVLLLLAILFLVLAPLRGRRFFGPGIAAHGLIALLFLPWLFQLWGELGSLRQSAPAWMTPATAWNWGTVFWYWFPFGPVGLPEQPPIPLAPVLGAATFLAPLLGAASALRRPLEPSRLLLLLGAGGCGIAVAFVTLLWSLQRFGVASVFHAPRYPGLAAAFWACGLVGLSGWAVERWGRSPGLAWGLAAPWLLCAALGQAWILPVEAAGPGSAVREALRPLPAGTSLYVMPSELIPFYRRTLAPYRAERIEALPCAAGGGEAWVLNLNVWRNFDRPRDLVAQRAIAGRVLSRDLDISRFPAPNYDYTLYHLRGLQPEAAARLCREGLQPAARPIPPQALSVALPERQRYTDGWSFPEVAPSLSLYRWGAAPAVTVRFDRALPPGDYRITYQGYRSASPRDPVEMELCLGEVRHRTVVPEGDFTARFDARFAGGVPRLEVRHPLWAPGGGDDRRLASAFFYAWIEQAGG